MDGDDSILGRAGVVGVALLVMLSMAAGAGVAVADNAYKVGGGGADDAGDDEEQEDEQEDGAEDGMEAGDDNGDDADDMEDMEVAADDVENTMDAMGMDMEMVEEMTGMTAQDIADMLNEMLAMMSASGSSAST